MTLSIMHRGKKLTQDQLNLIAPILNEHMQGYLTKREFEDAVHEALDAAMQKSVILYADFPVTKVLGVLEIIDGDSTRYEFFFSIEGLDKLFPDFDEMNEASQAIDSAFVSLDERLSHLNMKRLPLKSTKFVVRNHPELKDGSRIELYSWRSNLPSFVSFEASLFTPKKGSADRRQSAIVRVTEQFLSVQLSLTDEYAVTLDMIEWCDDGASARHFENLMLADA